eukprot:2201238-Alexandrium_andersonii.AAC.1
MLGTGRRGRGLTPTKAPLCHTAPTTAPAVEGFARPRRRLRTAHVGAAAPAAAHLGSVPTSGSGG